jgi:four helix bundle protein
MKENITAVKAIAFAIRIIKLYKVLADEQKEYILSKQMLRSGTAVGALIKEGEHAESKADFLHKMSISLKEANETSYWLFLLHEGGWLKSDVFREYDNECKELIRLLASTVKTTKTNLGR